MRPVASVFLALATLLILAPSTSANIVFQENFDSYAAGANINLGNSAWHPKWDGGDTTQQNLFKADAGGGGYAVLDTSVAKRNYHIPNQTSFTINTGEAVVISSDFQYSYTGGGNITSNLNKNVFGLMVSLDKNWWAGPNDYLTITNRGPAIGNSLPVSPYIETWMPHSNLGVNTAAGGFSEWFSIEWKLFESGGSIWGSAKIIDDEGPQTNAQLTTPLNLGITPGTPMFAGLSTNWNDVGAVPIESFSKIDAVHFDNFAVTAVPEPSAFLFGGLVCGGVAVLKYARKRRKAERLS